MKNTTEIAEIKRPGPPPAQSQAQQPGQVDPVKVIKYLREQLGAMAEENAILKVMLEERGNK
jgi:hypothetical protein